jgi:hypothetical protein
MRSDFVSYDGSDPAASWLAFDRPRSWPVLSDPTLDVACACTGRYGPVFEDGDWRTVISAINDGTSVEGIYLKQTSGLLTLDSKTDAATAAAAAFRDIPIQSLTAPAAVTVGGRSVWEIDGTLTATSDPSLRLKIRYLLVHNAAGTKTDHLILFAQDTHFDDLASRLDHVANSIVFKSQG